MTVSLLSFARGRKPYWTGTGNIQEVLNTWGTAINSLITGGVTNNLAFSAQDTTSAVSVAMSTVSAVNRFNITTSGKTVTLPSASGETTIYDGGVYEFVNNGSEDFDLLDNASGTITTVPADTTVAIGCIDDTTAAGTWELLNEHRKDIKIANSGYTLTIQASGLSADRTVSVGNVSGSLVTTATSATLINKTLGSGTTLGAELDGGGNGIINAFLSFSSLDAAQTFALADAGTLQRLTGSTNRIWTIPTNASVAFPIGTEIEVFNDGTAELTLTADTGVTVNGVTAGSITLFSNECGLLKKVETDRWIYVGDAKRNWI